MKLFDLNQEEQRQARQLLIWHLGYVLLIAVFFGVIYYFGYFKAVNLLKERFIFTFLAPICTLIFILLSPWRQDWRRAIVNTYERLEGEPAFCIMGGLVFFFGFHLYSVFLWAIGSLGPSILHM
ncbi:MAG: hypothetical protein LBP33_09975 [Candidatus Adiutrix sp.]|jgi:hypothetical protein|nr:hypothetical protein [Candidatus Adiutrix sp.]